MQPRDRQNHPHQRAESEEVAHDLLQPIATISALAQVALFQPDTPALVRKCLEDIRHEARYATDACEVLLVGDTERERIRLDQLSLAAQQSAASTRQCDITLVAEPAWVMADAVGLRRALTNVIDNACRAAGPGGKVEVRVSGQERPCVEVHDSGPGFGAGPNGRASMGLGIVRRVINALGGDVTLTTSRLGGACVRLALPAEADVEVPSRSPSCPLNEADEAC